MIVFNRSYSYSVQGRKADEILKFIAVNFDYTFLQDEKEFSEVKELISKKIDELNKKYPKTVKYFVSVNGGYLRIRPANSVMKGIAIEFLNVRRFKIEGGEV